MNRHYPPRFQFHLRTLLIGVTLLAIPCGFVGSQAKIVRERKAMLENGHLTLSEVTPAGNRLPPIRVWLGDVDCCIMYFDPIVSETDLERYQVAFPEAQVARFADGRLIRR
jgi:hypothetical protein